MPKTEDTTREVVAEEVAAKVVAPVVLERQMIPREVVVNVATLTVAMLRVERVRVGRVRVGRVRVAEGVVREVAAGEPTAEANMALVVQYNHVPIQPSVVNTCSAKTVKAAKGSSVSFHTLLRKNNYGSRKGSTQQETRTTPGIIHRVEVLHNLLRTLFGSGNGSVTALPWSRKKIMIFG